MTRSNPARSTAAKVVTKLRTIDETAEIAPCPSGPSGAPSTAVIYPHTGLGVWCAFQTRTSRCFWLRVGVRNAGQVTARTVTCFRIVGKTPRKKKSQEEQTCHARSE
jgi:hypothetical protein